MSSPPPPVNPTRTPSQQVLPPLPPPHPLPTHLTDHFPYINKDTQALLIQKKWRHYHFTSLKKQARISSLTFKELEIGRRSLKLQELDSIESKLQGMEAHTKEEQTIERELSDLLTNKKLREEVDGFTQQLASKETLTVTKKLLKAIHSLASYIDPTLTKLPKQSQPTRSFLSAFMLTHHPKMLIETSSPEGKVLQESATTLIEKFKTLCTHLSLPLTEQKGESTRTSFQEFYLAWKTYIPLFETFRVKDRDSLCEALTSQYIKINTKRESLRYTTKARERELFELEGKQLAHLKERIKQLKGKEGIATLEEKIRESKAYQEVSVLTRLTEERFLHEIATNPSFKLEASEELPALEMTLKYIEEGIEGEPKNYTPLINLLKSIATRLSEITPHREDLSAVIHSKIEEFTAPLQSGKELNPQELLETVLFLLEHLKTLSNDTLRGEIDRWIKETSTKLEEGVPVLEFLPEALRMITHTTQKISIELINFQTQTFRDSFILKAAEKESALFNQHLEEYELTLDKTWVVMKHAIKQAQSLGLSPKRFYTKQGAHYLAVASTLNLLSLSHQNFQEMCPETFLFDKETLNQQRTHYQTLRLTLFSLTLAERALSTPLTPHEKHTLLYTIQETPLSHPNRCAKKIAQSIGAIGARRALTLSKTEQKDLKTLLKKATHNENNFLALVDVSLGKALFSHLTTGHLPPSHHQNPSIALLIPQIEALSRRLNPILSFNATIHKTLYQEILSDFAHETLLDTLTQEGPLTPHACSEIYLEKLEPLQHLQEQLKLTLGVATGLSLIKSRVVTSGSWDAIYPVDEARFEHLIKSSNLLKMRHSQKQLEHEVSTLFQKECARLDTPLKPTTLPTLIKQMNHAWTQWLISQTAQQTVKKLLQTETPPPIKPYSSYIASFLCQELEMEPERFEKDPYTVQMAIYLTYTWQAFCKTTVKQNTRVQLKDEEIESLVEKYQVNKTLLASKINGPTLLAGLLRTTRDILKGRGQHFVDIETFALKLKKCFSLSHPGTQGYLDICKTLIKKSLLNRSPITSEEHLPRNARKMMLKFLTPTLFDMLTAIKNLFIETHGTLFEKEDPESIRLPPTMSSGRR